MNQRYEKIVIAVLILLFCNTVHSQTTDGGQRKPPPKEYAACKTAMPLQIDGVLSEAPWQSALWTDDFVDIQGDLRPLPRFRTRVKMLWDDNYFYIGAELEEPHVWATLRQRDTIIYHDNDFELFIDPDSDSREYYEFEMNAFNTVWDLFLTGPYKNGGKAITSWDCNGLKTAVHICGTCNNPRDVDTGWCVEIAVPWNALKEYAHCSLPPREGDQWRVNFSRVEWLHEIVAGNYRKIKGKAEDNWVWSPQWVINMHQPETWGYVQFLSRKPGEKSESPLRHD